jgi:hypothetical protein
MDDKTLVGFVSWQWYPCVERSYTISNIDKTCSSMASKAPRHARQQRRMLVDMRIRSVSSWGPSSRRGNTTAWALRFCKAAGGRKEGGYRRDPSYLISCLWLYKILINIGWEYHFHILFSRWEWNFNINWWSIFLPLRRGVHPSRLASLISFVIISCVLVNYLVLAGCYVLA